MNKSDKKSKIINQSKLIEETAERLDYYPKDVKKILDTYMDVITDHIFDLDDYNKTLAIRIFPSIQLIIGVVPTLRTNSVKHFNGEEDIVYEHLTYELKLGDYFKRTINSIFRAKHDIYDGWFKQFQKEKRKKDMAIWQRQQNKIKYGEAEYSDTSVTDYDVVPPTEIKGTFGERLKKNKNKRKTKGNKNMRKSVR